MDACILYCIPTHILHTCHGIAYAWHWTFRNGELWNCVCLHNSIRPNKCIANSDILCAVWNLQTVNVWVCLRWSSIGLFHTVFSKGSTILLLVWSIGRTDGWLFRSLSLGYAYKCNQISESRERKKEKERNFSALHKFIEWHRRTHANVGQNVDLEPFECVSVHIIEHLIEVFFSFFFFLLLYNANTRQILCVAGYGWLAGLFVCMRHLGISLHFIFARVLLLCACKKRVAFSRTVGGGFDIRVYVRECVCVYVISLSLANKHSKQPNFEKLRYAISWLWAVVPKSYNTVCVSSSHSSQVKISLLTENNWKKKNTSSYSRCDKNFCEKSWINELLTNFNCPSES